LECGEESPLFLEKVVAKNDLDGRIKATPAVCGGRIFLRTDQTLYCLGN
jgi:hypothetical protein